MTDRRHSSIPSSGLIKNGIIQHLWLSPWTRWVGFRYLRSKKNSRFLSFITLISILGVALGVTSMIVVLSVMEGFESELKKRLMSSDLHVLISPSAQVSSFQNGYIQTSDGKNVELVLTDLFKNEEGSFTTVVSTEVIIKSGKKVTGAVLKGVDPSRLEKIRSQLVEKADPHLLMNTEGDLKGLMPSVLLGQELAYEMGIIPGDQLTLVSPTETDGPLNAVPRVKRYVVEGVYHSGLPEQELHTVFTSDNSVRSFLRRANAISNWEVTLKNFDHAASFASQLRKSPEMALYRVQDWQALNAHLFSSLKLERIAMFIMLAFIVIVASFNIVTTLTLMILQKKKEIAILKTMGAREGQVAAIFLSEGLFIGTIGVFGGAALGAVICFCLKRYEFISLPDIYYDRTLPVSFTPHYYVLVAICALLIVLAACLYPSRRAARLDPLEGIRFG